MHDANSPVLTRGDIEAIVGPVDEEKMAAIVGTGATQAELVEAFAWTGSDSERMAEAGKTLTGRVAELHEILTVEDEQWGED